MDIPSLHVYSPVDVYLSYFQFGLLFLREVFGGHLLSLRSEIVGS